MNSLIQRSLPPLRLLLYLEWILLGLGFLTTVLTPSLHDVPASPLLSIVCIALFGLMGLKLPTQQLIYKIFYTAAEFGIMLLPLILDYKARFLPVLGTIAVIRGCQMFRLPGRIIIVGLVFMSFLGMLFSRSQNLMFAKRAAGQLKDVSDLSSTTILVLKLNTALSLGLSLIFVLLLVNALLAERQSRQELAIAHEQLRRYALRIENQATLQERNRIAREIHDSLGHTLTAQTIQLENALLFLSSSIDQTKGFLSAAKQLGYQALQEVSRSVATLRADPLRGRSLEAAIGELIRDFHSNTALKPSCTIYLTTPLSSELNIAIYRITQEALTNIAKHSTATQVTIQLQSKAGQLHLFVADDGKGFYPEQNTTGFGLQGMRERAAALGGTLHIISQPEKGCQIQAIVPVSELSLISL